MSDYQQPDFYRFNQDSLELVKWVQSQLESASSILDLGAGSGIIGIELARHYKPQTLCLLELQSEFKDFLIHNQQNFAPATTRTEIVLSSFSQFFPKQRFDLIAVNPPYFLPGRGEASVSSQKHICRTFVQDNWQELGLCIKRCLKPNGLGFMVLRQDPYLIGEITNIFSNLGFKMNTEERSKIVLIKLSLTE